MLLLLGKVSYLTVIFQEETSSLHCCDHMNDRQLLHKWQVLPIALCYIYYTTGNSSYSNNFNPVFWSHILFAIKNSDYLQSLRESQGLEICLGTFGNEPLTSQPI